MQSWMDIKSKTDLVTGLEVKAAKECYATESDQVILEYKTSEVFARCAVQGAQLLEMKVNGEPLIWLSPNALFDGHSAIRGGVPICLPWFGVHENKAAPKHGFARNQNWVLNDAIELDQGVLLDFTFTSDDHPFYPYAFNARLRITLSSSPSFQLEVENKSQQTMPLGFALHSYFAVADLECTTVEELQGRTYLDNTKQLEAFSQVGPVAFGEEVDRVYEAASDNQKLQNGLHQVRVSATGMPTCIVWNPGPAALAVADIGKAYTSYVCLERGAAFADVISLAPGETHKATMAIEQSRD